MPNTYAIDLGIDTRTTGGAIGTMLSPFPMQAMLCLGIDPQNPSGDPFEADRLASWRGFVNGDLLVVRIFDITLPDTADPAPELTGLVWAACSIASMVDAPVMLLTGEHFQTAEDQYCPGYALPERDHLDCIYFWNDTHQAPVKITLTTGEKPRIALLSVTVAAQVDYGEGPVTKIFQVDPEMVVSPDNAPPP